MTEFFVHTRVAPAARGDAPSGGGRGLEGLAFHTPELVSEDAIRRDEGALARRWASPTRRVMGFFAGRLLLDGAGPRWLDAQAVDEAALMERIYLGDDGDGAAWFAVAFDPDASPPAPDAEMVDVRQVVAGMALDHSGPVAVARSVLSWHARHRFCANCGAQSTLTHGGWRRTCPACGTEHYPRVDPVVIMAVGRGDQLLLGRQASWPAGRYSCLAGFVEPGETPEAAVARETFEEAGVRVTAMRYWAAQPWPFPSNLMLGYLAITPDVALRVDKTELEDARWFSLDEAKQIVANTHADVKGPPAAAIAHHLIAAWVVHGREI